MVCCRKISRLITLVGLCAFAGAITWGAGVAEAAPLCARVMMPEISAADISATVTSLASMKLRIDLLKIENSSSHELQILSAQFPIKLAELQRALSAQSEKQVRELLMLEIEKQQGRRSEETSREKEQRTAELVLRPLYTHKRAIPLPASFGSRFEYLPEQSLVLLQTYDMGILRMNLKTGHFGKFTSYAKFWALTPDRQFIIHVSDSDLSVTKVNIQTRQATPIGTLSEGSWIQMDPSARTLMTNHYNELHVMHLNDGRTEVIPWEQGYPLLLSESKILMTDKNDDHYILDIPTQEKQYVKKANKKLDREAVIGEGKFVFYSSDKPLAPQFFDVQNLNQPVKPKMDAKDFAISAIANTPLEGKVLLYKYVDKKNKEWGIYSSIGKLAPLFTFSSYGRKGKIVDYPTNFSFAADGSSVAITVKENDQQNNSHHEIHIWEKFNE